MASHPCHLTVDEWQGWLTCSPLTSASTTVLPRQDTEPALPIAAAGEEQGQPELMTRGGKGGEHHLHATATLQQTSGRASSPALMSLGLAHSLLPPHPPTMYCLGEVLGLLS